MRHSLTVEKYGVALRPVGLDDAAFIVQLRNSPHALGNVGDSVTDLPSQERWLKSYFERANDWYFIVQTTRDHTPVGTVGVYDVAGTVGEWGRWIVLPGVPAGPASAWLALHVAFDVLNLEVALGHVVETNKAVLSFHERIGNPSVGWAANPRVIGGRTVRLVEYRATRADWPTMSAQLDRYAGIAKPLL